MTNFLHVVRSAYSKSIEDLRELARRNDINGVLGFLEFVNGRPTPDLVCLDLGIPPQERARFQGLISSYSTSYHNGVENGVLHLSQLIKELFTDTIGKVKESTKTFIDLAEGVEEFDRRFDSYLAENSLQGTDLKDKYRYLRYNIAEVVQLFKEVDRANKEEVDGLREKIRETVNQIRDFGKDSRLRNSGYGKLRSNFGKLVRHLNRYGEEVSTNYESLCENMDERFEDFEGRLKDVEENLGEEYDITPETKIISKDDVLRFAGAFDFVFRKAETNQRKPRLVIMPCTTYERKTDALLYFDRNGSLRKKRVTSKERQDLDRQIKIETDTKTSGDRIYFSITADVNSYLVKETLPDRREVERSRTYSWPRISCVLRALGSFIYHNVLVGETYDPKGLYVDGEFVGPFRSGELRPGGLARTLVTYKHFLQKHGRPGEVEAKLGDVEMSKWNEATWEEIMGMVSGCVVYSKVSREFPISIDGQRNPNNFYMCVVPAFRGALGI